MSVPRAAAWAAALLSTSVYVTLTLIWVTYNIHGHPDLSRLFAIGVVIAWMSVIVLEACDAVNRRMDLVVRAVYQQPHVAHIAPEGERTSSVTQLR